MGRARDKADEFVALLRPLQGSLEGYSRRMLRDGSHTEDVLQSAVAAAFARFQGGLEVRDFKAWVFRFVTLEAFNRNRKHEPVAFGEIPIELPIAESAELVALEDAFAAVLDDPDTAVAHFDDELADALTRLSPPERAVLLLRAVGEFSYQEIHDILSIPIGSVMGYLSRARTRLRVELAEYAEARGLFRNTRPPGGPHP